MVKNFFKFLYSPLTLFLLYLGGCTTVALGQGQDLKTLSLEQTLAWVKLYHPTALQAQMNISMAQAELLAAKGNFGPSISNYSSKKTFDGINYYQVSNPEIYLPTWFGVEVYAGLETHNGARTNPEETKGKTNYLGINIPLAKNLVLDKRRAALKQAQIAIKSSQAERLAILNDVLYEAAQAFFDWELAYRQWLLTKQAVEVSKQRLAITVQTVNQGERAAIDTTEALSQLLTFQIEAEAEKLAVDQALLMLSVHLWGPQQASIDLPNTLVPSYTTSGTLAKLEELRFADIGTHPSLQQYNLKQESLNLDRRLKQQDLLPKIDLSLQHLGKGYTMGNNLFNGTLNNNYQIGWKLDMPLLFQQGRAAYKQAKIKLENNDLSIRFKRNELTNKRANYYAQAQSLGTQIALSARGLTAYEALVKAEQIRFEQGESSIFLINARESKALEARQKLLSLQVKQQKSIVALEWAAGLLPR
jgi:outer membrane protein TolC